MENFDTPHPSTVKTSHKERCWNARLPNNASYLAINWWYEGLFADDPAEWVLAYRQVYIEDRMTKTCQQRKGSAPPGCEGCKDLKPT